MSPPTSRDSEKFVLRLPAGMRARIKAAATRNNRTMNAEIVAALEEKFPTPTIWQYVTDKLGLDAILELINTEKANLPAAVRKMNKRMASEDIPCRFAMRKGKVQIVAIGECWTEDMALEGLGNEE
jgi:hypothetical protein